MSVSSGHLAITGSLCSPVDVHYGKMFISVRVARLVSVFVLSCMREMSVMLAHSRNLDAA